MKPYKALSQHQHPSSTLSRTQQIYLQNIDKMDLRRHNIQISLLGIDPKGKNFEQRECYKWSNLKIHHSHWDARFEMPLHRWWDLRIYLPLLAPKICLFFHKLYIYTEGFKGFKWEVICWIFWIEWYLNECFECFQTYYQRMLNILNRMLSLYFHHITCL